MSTFAFFNLSPPMILFLLVLGVLLFGRRLPEVGRSLGKGIIEFKKGLAGIEDEVDTAVKKQPESAPAVAEAPKPPQRITTPAAPKFVETTPEAPHAPESSQPPIA